MKDLLPIILNEFDVLFFLVHHVEGLVELGEGVLIRLCEICGLGILRQCLLPRIVTITSSHV